MVAFSCYSAQYLNLIRLCDGRSAEVWILYKPVDVFKRGDLKRLEVIAHPANLVRCSVHSWRQAVKDTGSKVVEVQRIEDSGLIESLHCFCSRWEELSNFTLTDCRVHNRMSDRREDLIGHERWTPMFPKIVGNNRQVTRYRLNSVYKGSDEIVITRF
jgi:hypothetical protein